MLPTPASQGEGSKRVPPRVRAGENKVFYNTMFYMPLLTINDLLSSPSDNNKMSRYAVPPRSVGCSVPRQRGRRWPYRDDAMPKANNGLGKCLSEKDLSSRQALLSSSSENNGSCAACIGLA